MNKFVFLFTLISLFNQLLFAQEFPQIEGITFQALTPNSKSNHKLQHIKTIKVPNGYLLISREWGGSGHNATNTGFRVRSSEQNVISLFDENLVLQKSFITENTSEKGYEDLQAYYLEGQELSLIWKRTEKKSINFFYERINISNMTTSTKKNIIPQINTEETNLFFGLDNSLYIFYKSSKDPNKWELKHFETTENLKLLNTRPLSENEKIKSIDTNKTQYLPPHSSGLGKDICKPMYIFGYTNRNDEVQVTSLKISLSIKENKEVNFEKKEISFSSDFIMEGANEKQIKKYNKALSQGNSIGFDDLSIRWFISTKSGIFYICSDVQEWDTKMDSRSSYHETYSIYTKNQIIITKLNKQGDLEWHKKIDKSFPPIIPRGKHIDLDKRLYFYVKNADNIELIGTMRNPDEKKHSLTRIKIHADGSTSEQVIYSFDKKNGEVIEEFIWDSVEFMEEERTLIGICTYGRNNNAIFKLKLD